MNHEGYEERLSLVKSTLKAHGLEAVSITPLEYDEACPFPYNNFIYKITLSRPASSDNFKDTLSPCTSLPPQDGVSTLVMRLSNLAAEGLNQNNRVENEVAALHLARKGLSTATARPELAAVIPAVYDWKRAEGTRLGWTLMEFLSGTSLDQHFGSLREAEKQDVLVQLSDIFANIQRTSLPAGVTSYGGLKINEKGEIVSGQMTTLKGGPWDTYGGFLRARLHSQLGGADGSEVLQGWRPNGVRDRVDVFLDSQLEKAMEEAGVDMTARVLVHGDFTLNNVLFDSTTNRITGLVDFDFSSICHPSQEFFTSFHDFGGNALADGSPEGKMWESAMAANELTRPGTIKGMETIKLVCKLESLLCPFRLVHPIFVKKKTKEQIDEERAKGEAALIECLMALSA